MQITINEILQFILLKRYVNRKKCYLKVYGLHNQLCYLCKDYTINGKTIILKSIVKGDK